MNLSLDALEKIIVSSLAHNFAPIAHSNITNYGSMDDVDVGVSDFKQPAPHDWTGIASISTMRPLTPDQAADIVDKTLEETPRIVTPQPTPRSTSPADKKVASFKKVVRVAHKFAHKSHVSKHRPSKLKSLIKKKRTRSSCSLPTTNDPEDESFSMKLYTNADNGKINPVHIRIRRDVLEVRRTLSHKVYFQCAFCKHLPRSERATPRSIVAPQRIANLYRGIIHFMMDHARECEHIPQEIKDLNPKALRSGSMRGVKKYWIESAKGIGLVDGADGSSIVCGIIDKTK